ncbi:rhomboid family intramembrane serine protease [Chelatococcus sp. SYSU_G07232]|uniref:Rhomboid family intramembrane serine protease n=1 Tax=Chelatococcus albus TaxID=3047466 RepID=A0ABT7AJ31_9HYPH|nr:rhomboid family intramembrane serine protease [Chelatococcus sp. SYSU_G07232]MDJ1159390.1 rhomboid family intramembrane serine protease [Chelatococcus sp. SYSU_G07232]
MSFEPLPPRSPREPMFNAPTVLVILIAVLVLIHVGRIFLGEEADFRLVLDFGFIPARFLVGLDPEWLAAVAEHIAEEDGEGAGQRLILARIVLGPGDWKPWTLLTYAFLHGSWLHLAFNSLWLLAFGSPVARRFGPARFLLLFAVCAVAGAAAHLVSHPYDLLPVVGASGAISGCMAAAVRFAFQPSRPLSMLHHERDAADMQPAPPLGVIVRDRRAATFLVVWFATNIALGLGSVPGPEGVSIAWEAHVGGFLAGLVLFRLFDPVPRSPATKV